MSIKLMTDDDEYYNDLAYRAGVLMGRRQALNDVIERLAATSSRPAEATLTEIRAWCGQMETDLDVELLVLVSEQQHWKDR